jgi:chromosome segregation ATPase
MAAVWVWVLVLVWLLVVGATFGLVALRGLQTVKQARRTRRATKQQIRRLNRGADRAKANAATLNGRTAELQANVAELQASLAELNVLVDALTEPRRILDKARRYLQP